MHIWAINFERNIRYKNEQVLWQGWDRNYELENISQAGTLTGIGNIGYAKRFELKPYGLAVFEKREGQETKYPLKAGGDFNINLSPTLKLNLTTNTDFAHVEADRIAVNLTRFNLFYPKKRDRVLLQVLQSWFGGLRFDKKAGGLERQRLIIVGMLPWMLSLRD